MENTNFDSSKWHYLDRRSSPLTDLLSLEDLYIRLLDLGATEVAVGRLNNWNNQPEVVCFRVPDLCTLRTIKSDDRLDQGYIVLPIWEGAKLCDRVKNVVLSLP